MREATSDIGGQGDRLYEVLADELRRLIGNGTFLVGSRLPSVRGLALQKGVSISTALKAYQTLEDWGLVRAAPQSGYFVRAKPDEGCCGVACSAPPDTPIAVSITDLVCELLQAAGDTNLVPLGSALPSADFMPITKLRRALRDTLRKPDARMEIEAQPAGFKELRRVIARRMMGAGITASPDELIVTNGCMEALNLALRAVTRPGDTVAVESPAYFGTLQALDDLGLRALELPTDPLEGVQVERLCDIAAQGRIQAAVLTPTVQNPLGSVMPMANKRVLAEALAARGVPIIEDDIYGETVFGNQPRPPALKHFDPSGNVIYCSSFSKTVAPGYRVGWIAPGRFFARVNALKASNSFASSGPAQLAMAGFAEQPGFETHLRKQRRDFECAVDRFMEAVISTFPSNTRMTRPQGGYLLWIQVPGLDTRVLYRHAVAHGISIAPGCLFSARDAFPDCFRLNCAHPWSPEIEQAIAELGKLARGLVDTHRSRTTTEDQHV